MSGSLSQQSTKAQFTFVCVRHLVIVGHPENSTVRGFDCQDIKATIVRTAVEKNYKSVPFSTETAKKGRRLPDQTFSKPSWKPFKYISLVFPLPHLEKKKKKKKREGLLE